MLSEQFVEKWRNTGLARREAGYELFVDPCHLIWHRILDQVVYLNYCGLTEWSE